jgi:hypothetical protein
VGDADDPPRRALWDPTVDVTPNRRTPQANDVEVAKTEVDGAGVVPAPRSRSPFDGGPERFEVRGELGRGGMGRVEDAFDTALGRPVAVKHALRGDDLAMARFEREARLTARLEHPGIVPLHEAGRDADGTPYYVMRRVDGRLLDALLAASAAPTALAERLALIPNVLAACDAVGYAHARGVIHRDLKPGNILVGPFGETVVIDWGLARELAVDAGTSSTALPVSDDGLTAAGTVAGTPGYMAPEQARGEPVDARADVFALGATLFYVVVGRAPYHGGSATELIGRAGSNRPAEWRMWPRGVPDDLRAIVAKALAVDPGERYPDAAALAADLRRFVTGQLVGAHRYNTAARLRRFVRRHRAAVAVATASAVVVAGVAAWAIRNVIRERDHATAAQAEAERTGRDARNTADEMLVDHARSLAATDPTGAIALLRRLDDGSTQWRDGWLAAVVARMHGVPVGFRRGHTGTQVELSADGRRVVDTAFDGEITVYDLPRRERHRVTQLGVPAECHWLGATTLGCSHNRPSQLALVDVATGGTRDLGLDVTEMIGDRTSRLVAQTDDRRLVELAGDGTIRELAHDVQLAAATVDLAKIVVARGDQLALLVGGAELAVGTLGRRPSMAMNTVVVRGDTIVALVDDTVVRWRLRGDRVVEDGRFPDTGAFGLAIARSHVFAMTAEGVRAIDVPAWPVTLHVGSLEPNSHGFATQEVHGGTTVYYEDMPIRIASPTRFTHIDVSPGGDTVAAVTTLDELVAYDLAALRPHDLRVDANEQLVRGGTSAAWTIDPTSGVSHHDLATARSTLALPTLGLIDPATWLAIANDDSWAALREAGTGPLFVYDAATNKRRGFDAANEAFDHDTDTLIVVARDGGLARWRSGDAVPRAIGKLAAAPRLLAVADEVAVTVTDAGTLARVALPGTPRDTAKLDVLVDDLVMTPDGRAWLKTDDGALWRWDVAAAPVPVELPEPNAEVSRLGGHVVARTAHAIVVLDTTPPRTIAVDARSLAALAGGYAIAAGSTEGVSLVDLDTGAVASLPMNAVDSAVTGAGDTIIVASDSDVDTRTLSVYQLGVPHDPAALRRWLADATNAGAAGNAVVWP